MIRNKLAQFCQSCQFSPFDINIIAVATSKAFGFVGPGELSIIRYDSLTKTNESLHQSHPTLQEIIKCPANDSILDCVWSETVDSIILAALGNGTITIYNLKSSTSQGQKQVTVVEPSSFLTGHQQEVSSLNWNIYYKNLVISASWDSSIILWDMNNLTNLLNINNAHYGAIYQATFSPLEPHLLASVGTDFKLTISDIRKAQPKIDTLNNSTHYNLNDNVVQSCLAHQHKVLCLDWNKYNQFQLATGAADGTIRIWDIRKLNSNSMTGSHISHTQAHKLAVRRVKFDPFHENILASCSYDMSVKIWDKRPSNTLSSFYPMDQPKVEESLSNKQTFNHHTEFILGLDWNLFQENLLCSTSWDKTVCLFNAPM